MQLDPSAVLKHWIRGSFIVWIRPGSASTMARTRRARRARGTRRRMATRRPTRRTGRRLQFPTGPAHVIARLAGRGGPYLPRMFNRPLWSKWSRWMKQRGTDMLVAGAVAGAAGRLKMDTSPPTIQRGIIRRSRSTPQMPYGDRGAGRRYRRVKRKVSFGGSTVSGVNQLTRSYIKYKRPMTVHRAVKKLEKHDSYNEGFIWQRISPLNGTTASLSLPNLNGDINILPVHVYRLDDKLDRNTFGQNTRAIAYDLQTVDATDNVQFGQIPGDNMTTLAQNAYGYQLLWSSGGAYSFPPPASTVDHSVLRHVKVDIMMRGVRTRPTVFKIQFVQFKREAIAPEHTWAAGSNQDAERTRFWTQYAKPLVSHPLANNPRDFHAGEYMKVLKTYYKSFQPDVTTNLDTTPLQHRMTLKLNLNRYCDYTQRFTPPAANVEDMFGNEPEVMIEQTSSSLHNHVGSWKARIYMIVSASVQSGPSTDNAMWPQYDISIRPVHTFKEPGV